MSDTPIMTESTTSDTSASEAIASGNAVERISNIVSFCVQFTYHCSPSPHTWDKTTRLLKFGESRWNWRRKAWHISTSVSFIVTLAQILMEFRYSLIPEKPTFLILFRRLQILGSIYFLVLQLNTVWKINEYTEFMNQVLRLFRLIEQDSILPTATLNRIFWVTRIITAFLFLLLLYLPFAFVISVAYPEFDPNIYSKLLPRIFKEKSVVGRREHWNPYIAFAAGILEFIVTTQLCYHGLNYAAFVSISSISALQLLQEMKHVIANRSDLNSILLDLNYFIKLYKSLYLLCNRLNDWIASIATPCALLTGMAITVSINYTLLTTTTNSFEKLALMGSVIGLVLFFGVCMQMASFLSFRSEETLRAMAVRRVVSESKYNSRRLRGCINCRSYFGSMFYFSQTTILKLGHIVVDYTIQSVLAFP